MSNSLVREKHFFVKYETLFMVFSVLLYIYFVIATFGFFGEVKDRSNYYLTFENLNSASLFTIFTGSSILIGLFSVFGNGFGMLSIYSIVFLTLKLHLLKKIFNSWAFIFLYFVKFAFVIDLILLKESLGILFILFAYSSRHKIIKYLYILTAALSHMSVVPLAFLKIEKTAL